MIVVNLNKLLRWKYRDHSNKYKGWSWLVTGLNDFILITFYRGENMINTSIPINTMKFLALTPNEMAKFTIDRHPHIFNDTSQSK
jgi:hypothetical protein